MWTVSVASTRWCVASPSLLGELAGTRAAERSSMDLIRLAERLRDAERAYSTALAEHDGSKASVVRYQAARLGHWTGKRTMLHLPDRWGSACADCVVERVTHATV